MANRKPTSTAFVLTIAVCMPVFLFFASICTCRATEQMRVSKPDCCCDSPSTTEPSHDTCGCFMCNSDSAPVPPPPPSDNLHLVRTFDPRPDMLIPSLSAFTPLILHSGAPPPDVSDYDSFCTADRSVVLRI